MKKDNLALSPTASLGYVCENVNNKKRLSEVPLKTVV